MFGEVGGTINVFYAISRESRCVGEGSSPPLMLTETLSVTLFTITHVFSIRTDNNRVYCPYARRFLRLGPEQRRQLHLSLKRLPRPPISLWRWEMLLSASENVTHDWVRLPWRGGHATHVPRQHTKPIHSHAHHLRHTYKHTTIATQEEHSHEHKQQVHAKAHSRIRSTYNAHSHTR